MSKKSLFWVVMVILGVAVLVSLALGKTDHKTKDSLKDENSTSDAMISFVEKKYQSGIECLSEGEVEKITSVSQLDSFVQTCDFEDNFLLEQGYDEDYFAENFLLIMAQTVSSGGYSFETESISERGKILISRSRTSDGEMVSTALVTHYTILEMDNGEEKTEFTVQYSED